MSGDNIEVNVQRIGCQGSDWIHLAQNETQFYVLVNAAMNLRVL
jgi:hypothetical protein